MITTSKTAPKLTARLKQVFQEPGPARAAWAIVLALSLAGALIGSARAETAAVQTGALAGAIPPLQHEAPSIRAALERTRQYPDAAYASHKPLDGRAIVSFDVDDGGHPQNIELVHRSGNSAFDRQTVDSVRAAVCIECRSKTYRITYDYRLQ